MMGVMRGIGAVWLAVMAGCYAPTPPTGVPCAEAREGARCPSDQQCVLRDGVELCESAAVVDAPIGDPTDTPDAQVDRDGDGVDDLIDDCPDTANPGQENEDGDRFGDVCDPCPIVADDNPPDTDGDQVADACDPRPMTPGDRIVTFEGFHNGIPAAWVKVGTWSAGAGSAISNPGGGGGIPF
jgi:hypothetical protein